MLYDEWSVDETLTIRAWRFICTECSAALQCNASGV